MLFDQDGTPYSPDFTNKGGKRYRYYISQNLIQYRDHPKGTMARIPAHEIEKVITDTLRNGLIEILALDRADDHATIDHILNNAPSAEALIRKTINRITVIQDELQIEVNGANLHRDLQTSLDLSIPVKFEKPDHVLTVPFTTRRSYKGAVIIKPDNSDHDPLDLPPYQLRNLVKGTIWRDEHFSGIAIKDIAARENLSESGIRKIIMASFDILLAA